jgi:hypothetical protein
MEISAMSERKTLCDLGLMSLDFGWADATTREPGNTFRLTFRHRNGQQTGCIDIDQVEAEQFALELTAVMAAIVAQLKWPQS